MTLENLTPKQKKEHYGRVARLGCILCRYIGHETDDSGCEIHHIRRAGKRGDAPVIGLCTYHHRGSNTSIHGMGRKRFEREYGISEEQLLEQTLELIGDRT